MSQQEQDEEEKPFTYVTSSRRNNRKRKPVIQQGTAAQRLLAENDRSGDGGRGAPTEAPLEKMKKSVDGHRSMLVQGKFGDSMRSCFNSFAQMLKGSATAIPQVIYALGMGSVATNRTAQIQLAFLLELRDYLESQGASTETSTSQTNSKALQSEPQPSDSTTQVHDPDTASTLTIKAYDPISSPSDHALLSQYNIQALTIPPTLTRLCTPTLLYMPHCPRPLYDQYLTASFTRTHLPNLILCANRLSRYEEFLPPHRVASELPAVWRLVPFLSLVEVPCDSYGALSDLAFQHWDSAANIARAVDESSGGRSTSSAPARSRKRTTPSRDVPRPTPDDGDDFWTLPERLPSDADAEVL